MSSGYRKWRKIMYKDGWSKEQVRELSKHFRYIAKIYANRKWHGVSYPSWKHGKWEI